MRRIIPFLGKVVGLGIIGGVGCVAGALTGVFILKENVFGFGGLVGAVMGMIIGYMVGVIAGFILMAKVFRSRGSLLFGILACITAVILTFILAEPLKLNVNPNILFAVFFLSVPLLGMAGFGLRRKPNN